MQKNYYKFKLTRSISKKILNLQRIISPKNFIAHHGIERSGTNFLRACLLYSGVKLINKFDPKEGSPGHKHFRWYKNKALIPDFREEFKNNVIVENIESLNLLCSYPKNTKHIIIKKERNDAIVSLANFGIRNGWFKDNDEALNSLDFIAKDYDNYYDFWIDMSRKNSKNVQIIKYESLVESSETLRKALIELNIPIKKCFPDKFSFQEVYHSPRNRKVFLEHDEVLKYLSS